MDDKDLTNQKKLEYFKSRLAHSEEMTRATATFEHAALKPPLLLNGGALIATLTLYGAIKFGETVWELLFVLLALLGWAFGLLCAALVTGHAFQSQLEFYKSTSQEIKATVKREFNGNPAAADESESKHLEFAGQGSQKRDKAIELWKRSMRPFAAGVLFALVGLAIRYL